MKKKLLGVLLLSMALLTGCVKVDVVGDLGKEKQTEKSTMEKEEEAQTGTKETKDMKTINLTANNETEICIDYAINSYESIQKFSYELFKRNIEVENPVLSPASAYLALTLAGAGAEGETKDAFREVLGDLECIPNDLMIGLPRDTEKMQISLANSAWVDYHLTPNEEWLAWADSIYKSEVLQTSLAAEDTYKDMNKWIDEKTKGLIPMLYDKPLSEDARLFLLNTLYFKGEWASKFEAKNTREEDFVLDDGSVEQVEMMNKNHSHMLYVKDNHAEGVILPYCDDSMAFVALKPMEGMSVREMYANLTMEAINGMLEQEETTLCNLKLPKFEVEFHQKLNDSLIYMGLGIAFKDGAADFSGIGTLDDAPNMYISQVQQKAVVIVDEEGTEAAAVTSVEMFRVTGAYNPQMPIDVYFDEPFLYMIVDRERKVPLFIGIMDNPNA